MRTRLQGTTCVGLSGVVIGGMQHVRQYGWYTLVVLMLPHLMLYIPVA